MKQSYSLPAALILSLAGSMLSHHVSAQACEPACGEGQVCVSGGSCVEAVPVEADVSVEVQVTTDAQVQTAAVQADPIQADPNQAVPPAPVQAVPVDDARGGYAPAQQGAQEFGPQAYQAPLPSLAHAGQLRLKLGFLLGFGGRQSVSYDDESIPEYSEGLAPSYGVELEIQKTFGPVFYTSGTLRYTSLDLGGDTDRFGVFGFDLGVGLHYAFDVGPVAIDPFFSAHAGIAFGSNGEYGAFGVAVALKLGANLWFHRMIGAYLSAGYRGSAFLSGARAGTSGSNLRQGTMDLGVVFRFGE